MSSDTSNAQESSGILWSIDGNGLLKIAKSESGDGSIPVTPFTYSQTVTDDEGYEKTTFLFEGVFLKPWTHEQDKEDREVIVEEGITDIPFGTISDMENCTKISIPDTVQTIGKWAFRCCKSLESIHLPEGIPYIGEETFLSCSALSSIKIPKSVTRIEKSAFRFCSGLTQITFPEGLLSIGESAFEYCSGLKTVTIPESVTRIGRNAFSWCRDLRKAFIPADRVETFRNAFDKYQAGMGKDGKMIAFGTMLVPERPSIFTRLFRKKQPLS